MKTTTAMIQNERGGVVASNADQSAEEELESLALEGLNSGENIQPDSAYWDDKHRRLDERLKRSTAG